VTFTIHFREPNDGPQLIASVGASTIAPADANPSNDVIVA
jgi:hypothetical protein